MVECDGKKFPMLKLFKCLLTVSRGILLVAFISIGRYIMPRPMISFVTVFFYSFKFSVGLIITGIIIFTLIIHFLVLRFFTDSTLPTKSLTKKILGTLFPDTLAQLSL